jgi:hypothetical protein
MTLYLPVERVDDSRKKENEELWEEGRLQLQNLQGRSDSKNTEQKKYDKNYAEF